MEQAAPGIEAVNLAGKTLASSVPSMAVFRHEQPVEPLLQNRICFA